MKMKFVAKRMKNKIIVWIDFQNHYLEVKIHYYILRYTARLALKLMRLVKITY